MALFVGLISGTSVDSVDAALVEFGDTQPRLISVVNHSFPDDLRKRLLELNTAPTITLPQLGELDHRIGVLFAEACNKLLEGCGVDAGRVRAIGSHGQTIHHAPKPPYPFTMQIGDPNIIAEQTGIAVVADFRRRDMAAGGQGAPLVPAFHQAIFSDAENARAVVNIGGIANVTTLPSAESKDKLLGFDTGPGNCLLDSWIQRHLHQSVDIDGRWGAGGHLIPQLLDELMQFDFFNMAPPKSTGREVFHLDWLQARLSQEHAPQDVQATLCHFTARSICEAIKRFAPATKQMFVCGGGAHNQFLMQLLGEHFKGDVESTESLGVSPDWVEATAFAWLAMEHLEGRAGNLPQCSGAEHAVPLGGLYPGPV